MVKSKQVKHGKAYEYAIASALAKQTSTTIKNSDPVRICHEHYMGLPPALQSTMDDGANKAIKFLMENDKTIMQATHIDIQSDQKGQEGDVRDVLLYQDNKILFGISAKHKHQAIKHSRLSDKIDFGQEWGGYPVSNDYWKSVSKIFGVLRQQKESSNGKALFKDLPNKEDHIYLPILVAFEDELKKLIGEHGGKFCRNMFRYLIGKESFYKIVNESKSVSIRSFNLTGNLSWGKKLVMPSHIKDLERKKKSTLLVSFNEGWELSFRLHNADRKITPSLKFDINFVGISDKVSKHEIPLTT